MKTLLESIMVIVPDLQYLRARYYDPNMGRFMQQDTLFGEMERPLTQNLYIYCLNNGVNLRDPSGNRSVDSIKSDVNRYKDQLASAKSSGAGQSVLDEIQKTIDSLIKELGNELSKPKPKPNPSTKPPKKPDWGDTSNPYNPVNNPNSVGSILSGADNYWSSGGGSSGGGGYAPTQEDAMREAEAKRKLDEEKSKLDKVKKLIKDGLFFPYSIDVRKDYPNYTSGGEHSGTDFPAPEGTPIHSVSDGIIIKVTNVFPNNFNVYGQAKPQNTYGNYVVVEGNVNGILYHFFYAHMINNKTAPEVGGKVSLGDVIGYVGNTGNSSGNHLHFEVREYPFKYGTDTNPSSFLKQ